MQRLLVIDLRDGNLGALDDGGALLLIRIPVTGDFGEERGGLFVVHGLPGDAGRAVEALVGLSLRVLVAARQVEGLGGFVDAAFAAQVYAAVVMDFLDEHVRIPVPGNFPQQGEGGFGVVDVHRLHRRVVPGVQVKGGAVLVAAQVGKGRAGRFPLAPFEQLAGADVGDLSQAGRSLVLVAQGGVEGFGLVVAALGEHDLRPEPVAVGNILRIIQSGVQRAGLKNLFLRCCADKLLRLIHLALAHHGVRILVIAQCRKLLRRLLIRPGLIFLLGQLILHIGHAVFISGKGQPGDDHQRHGELPHPGVAALAAHEVLLVRKSAAGFPQGLAAVLGQGSLPLGDHRVDGFLAEAAEDLVLLPVAAGTNERVVQVGTTANADPVSPVLHGIAAGHVARNGAQCGQLCRAVQVVGLIHEGVVLLVPPDGGIVEPHLLHRDLVPFRGDMPLHRHRHMEGAARRAVQAPAPVDDLRRFLAVRGREQERDLHAHHLQGGQVEQRHLALRLVRRGQGRFPGLNRAGQVDAHRHVEHILSSGKNYSAYSMISVSAMTLKFRCSTTLRPSLAVKP